MGGKQNISCAPGYRWVGKPLCKCIISEAETSPDRDTSGAETSPDRDTSGGGGGGY